MDENTFNLLNNLKNEVESIGEDKNHIFHASDSTKFIESYIIELISFYNERYKEYQNIIFSRIKDFIPYIRIDKNFILTLKPLDINETIEIIHKKNPNLATLIENTDIVNKLSFPLDVTDEMCFSKADYLKESLVDALNVYDIKSLIKSSHTLFVLPAELDFITIYFGKRQLMFLNYFDAIKINPFNNHPLQLIGEDKEIYRKANIMTPEQAVSIDNLAIYHKKTKRRSVDFIVNQYKDFYEFISKSENYLKIRNHLYRFVLNNYPDLCS
jgi:hypothetical protein